jgi:hypothetical protein
VEKKIRELISKFLQEYTGTGDSGGNATDGNDITSPRPFADDEDEIENYIYKSIYGGDGGHYRNEPASANPNRTKMGMFELKKLIKKITKEQAYGHATLTTQGPPRTGTIVPTDEYPFSARPKRTATGMMEDKINEESMEDLNDDDIDCDRCKAKVAIKKIQKQRQDAINAAGVGKAQATQGISQQEEQLAALNQQITTKSQEYTSNRGNLEKTTKRFHEMSIETPEEQKAKEEVLVQVYELKDKVEADKKSLSDLRKQRNEMTKTIQQAVSAQTQQPSVTKQFDQQLRDANKALSQIGKSMKETLLQQYIRERANVNLMEQMDLYNETTRGSLQKFFEMFEDGKTTSEVIQHYAKNGIQIPEQFCSKVKKHFESYKKLKLELGFSDQEAKDFKKSIVPKEKTKKLSTKIFKK